MSTYNAFRLRVEKRLSRGLTFTGIYIFSRMTDNNVSSLINPRPYASIGSLDQTHVGRVAFSYDLPAQFREPGMGYSVLRQVAGGWRLSGLLERRHRSAAFDLGFEWPSGSHRRSEHIRIDLRPPRQRPHRSRYRLPGQSVYQSKRISVARHQICYSHGSPVLRRSARAPHRLAESKRIQVL